ncbi:hypothetical protein E1B28_001950 [Marasmius oreades]|uniref:Uncharacterized protein n=1 Tax=Marasmius oreades TaxID=181124 RepID=A0A9P8AGD5_9AGAR|nr:uncharacterized protein E1B28_001950 [Marasmius oreades]KAG7100170.1 hypothetical protein E1B28_001950 [Marasmius oreades]
MSVTGHRLFAKYERLRKWCRGTLDLTSREGQQRLNSPPRKLFSRRGQGIGGCVSIGNSKRALCKLPKGMHKTPSTSF